MSPLSGSVTDPGAVQDLAYALQLGLGAVFLASVLPKLRHPRRFRHTVATYEVLPRNWARPAAWLVILSEALLVVSFIAGWAIALGLAVGIGLLAVFAAATATNLRRGRDIDCGCFGAASEKISARTLARLGILCFALLLLAGLIASDQASALTPAWWAESGAGVGYTLQALGISVPLALTALWILEFPTLFRVVRRTPSGSRRPSLDLASEA